MRKPLVVVLSLSLSLVGAEFAYRAFAPAPFSEPVILTSEGKVVPLSEVIHFLRISGEESAKNPLPMGMLPPGLVMQHKYDRPTWPYFDENGSVRIEINDLGFRDEPFEREKKEGELRILTIGDSFTFGSGVLLEDSWPQALERMLTAERPGPVEVINGGYAAGFHAPDGYWRWVETDGVRFDADVLVVGLCLNDMGPVPMLAYPVVDPKTWLGGVSHILNSIQRTLAQDEVKRRKQDATEIVRRDPLPWENSKGGLRRIHEALKRNDIRMIVAVFPMISLLGENHPYVGLHRMVAKFCEEEGIETVDLLDRFRGLEEMDLWVHATDQHPNHIGHKMIAEGIFEYLEAHPTKLRR